MLPRILPGEMIFPTIEAGIENRGNFVRQRVGDVDAIGSQLVAFMATQP